MAYLVTTFVITLTIFMSNVQSYENTYRYSKDKNTGTSPRRRNYQEKLEQLNSLITFQGNECKMLLNVQDSLLELYTSNHKYKKKVNKLEKRVAQLENEHKELKQMILDMKAQKNPPAKPPYYQEYPRPNQNEVSNKVEKMLQDMEQKTRNMSHTMMHRATHKYRILERKLENLKQQTEYEAQTHQWKEKEVMKLKVASRKSDQMLVKHENTMKDMSQKIEWLEHAYQKSFNGGLKTNVIQKGDGCPDGFLRYARSCYAFVNTTFNWEMAERHCLSLDRRAHLLSVESKEENDFVIAYRKYNAEKWTSPFWWAGGHDSDQEGSWKWVATGKPLTYTYWLPGEPNGHDDNQDCMYYTGDGEHKWDDWNCQSLKINFVCEIML